MVFSHNIQISTQLNTTQKKQQPEKEEKKMMRRERDAEAELNLPPGFRFHPSDEELVVHYLCRKVSYQSLPVPIIAEIDLYKYNPWQLPDMALFGTKEWYFFTPRDRKYPNGSRPNRAAGSGYWKATGADKPIRPAGSAKHIGIKKALVFYSGKAPRGAKTNWIMHEYRIAEPNRSSNKKGSLRLDEWVLCRIYNKKNNWQQTTQQQIQKEEQSLEETMDSLEAIEESGSFTTPESDVENESLVELNGQGLLQCELQCDPAQTMINGMQQKAIDTKGGLQLPDLVKEEENSDWFMDLNLDDLQNSFVAFGATPALDSSCQDYYYSGLLSPGMKPFRPDQLATFWNS